jgi:DNA gyrase subunit A
VAKRTNKKKQTKSKSASDDGQLFAGQGAGGDNGKGQTSTEPREQRYPLHQLTRSRYLNYALSVITSRALPDVRDGLKPVQRRILYTMWQQGLTANVKHRKCAKVIGDVMGNYHPHGDMAIYDALVRMAQPFSLRVPFVDGSGNFGSLDGDPPAAMRYTECRLTPVAGEILGEINQNTVHFRPNYDGSTTEPVVLPTKLPSLLVNGTTGIAVGMATNIPPHNPKEVCNALLKLLDNPELKTYQLVANDAIQGPDFPTGGQVLASRDELREIYKNGTGTIRLRGTWEQGKTTRGGQTAYITSIPYNVNKAQLVERIAEVVTQRKMPLLLDVKDLSTDDVRIALEMKKDADPQKVLAYLFKHTPLQQNFATNLTCLIPTENPEVGRPERSDLREILWHFLLFRLDVVTRRLQHELEQLEKRIHLLEGFAFAFDVLDRIIEIIRASDGKADAAKKILKEFGVDAYGEGGLDEQQVDAILELKLYRLAKLEIKVIQDELKDKRKRAKEIRKLLDESTEDTTQSGRWQLVRGEIETLVNDYAKADKRRTTLQVADDEPQYDAEDFIVAEDNHVLITADGWVKRQKEIKDPSRSRVREGDRVLACLAGSTTATAVFFTNFGVAYSCRIIDIPATTGYGEPIQKLFKLKDGEKVIAALSLDPRAIGDIQEDPNSDYCPYTHLLGATSDGFAFRLGLGAFAERSTKSGRRFARPAKGAEVIGAAAVHGHETIIAATKGRRAILCSVEEVNYLSNPGKGVQLIKLGADDRLLGVCAAASDRDTLTVKTSMGGEQRINTGKYEVTGRGGKGREIIKKGSLTEIVPQPVSSTPPALQER